MVGETSCPIVFGEVQLGVRRRKKEEEEEEWGLADKERAEQERREEERAGEEERSSTNSSSGKVYKISIPTRFPEMMSQLLIYPTIGASSTPGTVSKNYTMEKSFSDALVGSTPKVEIHLHCTNGGHVCSRW